MKTTLLRQMVSLRSVYPDEYRLGKFLGAYLIRNGFKVTTQKIAKRRYNIFATRGEGGKAILFYGHLDTVPVTDESKWKTPPLKLTQIDDRLYGLGAYDMKGGIAVFLEACVKSGGYVKIFLAAGEESISEGAWAAVQQNREFFTDCELIISPEPNFGIGTQGILRGRTGRYIFTVNFFGKPAHVAKYRDGVDAMAMAGKFITDFYTVREKLFLSRGTFIQIRKIEGEAIGMSVCGNTSVEVEILPTQHDTISGVQKRIQALTMGKVSLKSRKTPYLPGYYFDTFSYQREIGDIIQRFTGKTMELHTRISVGDDNVLATTGIPVITWGPDGGNAHAPNEYVLQSSLDAISQMFCEFLKKKLR